MSRPQPQELYYAREEFRRWCAAQPGGRYERVGGHVVAMSPERLDHIRVKVRVFNALDRAIATAGVRCEAVSGGMTVETGDNDYEPDALVNCGPAMSGDAISATNPVIIVEVLSPSTAATDTGGKLADYFMVKSVVHYLIVHSTKKTVIHHRRDDTAGIVTQILSSGKLRLDPPGIEMMVEAFYPAE